MSSTPSLKIGLIYAVSENNVIGINGQLPWTIPEDMLHFQEITRNSSVIMGRKTWESIPAVNRPLSKRLNIVVSRNPDKVLDQAYANAYTAHSIKLALEMAKQVQEVYPMCWIIGGGEIYQQTIHLADRLEVTLIKAKCEGNTFAPEIPDHFKVVSRKFIRTQDGLFIEFISYRRR